MEGRPLPAGHCGQYGAVYPENALTRLRHLAAADSERVRHAVREAVTRLAANEQHRMRVLGTVVTSAKSPKSVNATATLSVDPEARRAAQEHDRYRAQTEHWRLLKDTVFADPVMACVWWLDGHPERLEKLPHMDAAFERLTALTNSGGGRGDDLMHVANLLHQFLAGLEAVDRQRLIDSVGYIMTNFGRGDLADQLKTS